MGRATARAAFAAALALMLTAHIAAAQQAPAAPEAPAPTDAPAMTRQAPAAAPTLPPAAGTTRSGRTRPGRRRRAPARPLAVGHVPWPPTWW